jgi:threonine synthase
MKYLSTRGNNQRLDFIDVLTSGTAKDGGLFMPETFPNFSESEINQFKTASYQELASNLLFPYIEGFLSKSEFESVVKKAYDSFSIPEVVKLRETQNLGFVLELFHGPTFAFKDVAMQLLAALLDKAAEKTDKKIVVLGATSGDTGSAAIEACKSFKDINIVILFPDQKISAVQQRQMTTSNSNNVYPLAVKGDFDDCQNYVKRMFVENKNDDVKFVSINSINWTRIMAQSVYFFYTKLQLEKDFIASIPSGNFGHAYAGWTAKNMGLSFKGINIATNKNDVLHRLFSDEIYLRKETEASLAPSMDISVASNFERLLFEIYERNGETLNNIFSSFPGKPIEFKNLSNDVWLEVKAFFQSSSCRDEDILDTIEKNYLTENILFDPHTATAIKGNNDLGYDLAELVTFATAHPAKFPDAVNAKLNVLEEQTPEKLKDIMTKDESYSVLENSFSDLESFINQKVLS